MKKGVFVLGFMLWSNLAYSLPFTSELFELHSDRAKKLFTAESKEEIKEDGRFLAIVDYKDPDGNLVLHETSLTRGNQIIRVEVEQKQLNQTASVEVKDGKIFFTKTVEGKTKTDSEKKRETFVMSGNFVPFIHEHWADLLAGKTVELRYGVWDRLETVGFELRKTHEEEKDGQKLVSVKMKPSSFVIAALVNPMEMTFNADGTKLIEMKGRVPPKQKVGDTYKDLDAEVVYKYQP